MLVVSRQYIFILLTFTCFSTLIEVKINKPEPIEGQYIVDIPDSQSIKPSTEYKPLLLTYEQYLKQYKKGKSENINKEQYQFRRRVFQRNLQFINQFNRKSQSDYKMGLNPFTDMPDFQFDSSYKSSISSKHRQIWLDDIKPKQEQQKKVSLFKTKVSLGTYRLPDGEYVGPNQSYRLNRYTNPRNFTIDWRNVSGPESDQGRCNSCYIFAAINSIQISLRIRNITNFQPLSIQEVVSCIKDISEMQGCSGGNSVDVFHYIFTQGVGLAKDYPYTNQDYIPLRCKKELIQSPAYAKNKFFIRDYNRIKIGDCKEMVEVLRKTSLSAVIASENLQFYKSGIFRNPFNGWFDSIDQMDHVVTIVGYNYIDRTFIIKNSWGKGWGMDGFGIVKWNTGVCSFTSYPVIFEKRTNN